MRFGLDHVEVETELNQRTRGAVEPAVRTTIFFSQMGELPLLSGHDSLFEYFPS
jgi:hypothetical protein